jgi:chromosome segregation protein
MFKLQRLEITGFKSFADYTEIVFTGNGITAVVGPNGCGKSNVSDSISWVLGEQRAKSLRGGEMKDVVFQGTKNRKPSGMAEVVLHLVRDESTFDFDDNELEDIDETLGEIDELAVDVDAIEAEQAGAGETADAVAETNGFHADDEAVFEKARAAQVGSVQTVERTVKTKRHWRPRSFALDFTPGEAVSVARRLYLSGESEYLLNGKTCRLRDIQDLFAGTGLSGAHYAIIEQGRIGQILSAKPADRRNLIEEAAGISKFRTRQRAAESRIDSAKINLGRISDIVSEIEKQAASLRRQAAKTRRFVVLQDEFRVLLRQLFAAEGRHLATLIAELEASFGNAAEAEKAVAEQVVQQEERVRAATKTARDAEEALADVRRQHSDNALERDRAERELRYQSEQIATLGRRLETLGAENDALAERLRLAAAERERLELEEQKESAEADANRLILIEAEDIYSKKLDDVRVIEREIEECRAELLRHTAAVERFDEIARQLSQNLERVRQRAEGLDREGVRAGEAFSGHTTDAEKTAAELSAESAKLAGLHNEKQQFMDVAAVVREKLAGSENAAQEARSELLRSKNRLETLQELEEKRTVYAPPIQRLFAERSKIGAKLYGVLADHLNVSQPCEAAVENLFGSHLESVIVSSMADARKVAEWLRSSNSGRASILIVPGIGDSKAVDRKAAGDARTVAEALGTAPEIISALRQVFPRELSAEFVEDLDGSSPANGTVVVNFDGEILVGKAMLVGGRAAASGENESLLAFKRELSELAGSVARLEGAVDTAAERAAADRRELSKIEEKAVDLQSLIIKVERHILGLELHEKAVRQEIERAERHRKVVADEAGQVLAEIREIESRIAEAIASRSSAEEMRLAAESELSRVAGVILQARQVAEAENAVLNEKRTLAATSGERRRSAQSALRRLENEVVDLESRRAQFEHEREEAESLRAELYPSVEALSRRIAGSDAEVLAEAANLEAALKAVAEERIAADKASEELSELNRRAADAMNERAEIEVRQAEAATELKNIREHCEQELSISLAELAETEEIPEGFILDEARAKADDLRRRLEGFGAINMLAVEELIEAEERLLFLSSQRQDIIDSIASAEEALREIKERSRERFRNAFEAINENFREYFSELFGGGRGEMTLLESDDILEAGIEVVAQPPGKRLQNILLLSGGEKAMTAIALVLAIFKYRPSPFCLLDEVDAPLDDANVGRFINKIGEMSAKTQFIVITHNKRTMEAARALYGVTMQEAGVSKVVSVKFE